MGEEYSTDDLKNIFEIVNGDHLHLKGVRYCLRRQ